MKIDPALVAKLKSLAKQYPSDLVKAQLQDVPRVAFHISLVTSRKGPHCALCDLGGGIGLFSLGCAAVGMKVILVDDFHDAVNEKIPQERMPGVASGSVIRTIAPNRLQPSTRAQSSSSLGIVRK